MTTYNITANLFHIALGNLTTDFIGELIDICGKNATYKLKMKMYHRLLSIERNTEVPDISKIFTKDKILLKECINLLVFFMNSPFCENLMEHLHNCIENAENECSIGTRTEGEYLIFCNGTKNLLKFFNTLKTFIDMDYRIDYAKSSEGYDIIKVILIEN